MSRYDHSVVPKIAGRAVALATASVIAAGCAVTPSPVTIEEHRNRAQTDLAAMFDEVEPIAGPIDLHEAMARAIRYNLDRREELLNVVVNQQTLDLVTLDMLPDLSVAAGFNQRDSENASSSESVITGAQSLEPSFSEDRGLGTAELAFSWNVLDFGLSYVRANQQADRVLIAGEQRRRVVNTIIQDVRLAYWRALAAQRLADRIEPLIVRVRFALENARQLEEQRLQPPLQALEYQRTLLTTLDRLTALQRELVGAKAQLAALMNLPPGQDYALVVPSEDEIFDLPELGLTVTEMEQVALINRPEVLEEVYQVRIAQLEVRRVMLSMLPSLSFDGALNYSANSFLVNSNWATGGVNVTWNLINLIRGVENIELAEANIDLVEARRLALSMAVLAQVNVSYLRFQQALAEFDSAAQLRDVEMRILDATTAQGQTAAIGELDVIQAEVSALLAELRRDAAYAGVQNAYGAMLVSIGADPLPETVADLSIETLSDGIRASLQAWEDGNVPLVLPQTAISRPLLPAEGEGIPMTGDADDLGTASDTAARAPGDNTIELVADEALPTQVEDLPNVTRRPLFDIGSIAALIDGFDTADGATPLHNP